MKSECKILVTGSGGFIGSHLVEALLRRGNCVRALVRYTSHAGTGWLATLPEQLRSRLEIFYGDITDARCVREAAQGCQRVFHLAALIGIPYSYSVPESYFNVNLRGTLNVLEAARVAMDRVVVASTSEVYGTALYTPIDEKHPLQHNPPTPPRKPVPINWP